MHIWLVCCGSIPGLIFSLVSNASMRCILRTAYVPNCVYDLSKPYGSTNRYDPFAQTTQDLYSRPDNEIQFSYRIRRNETVFYDRKLVVSTLISL